MLGNGVRLVIGLPIFLGTASCGICLLPQTAPLGQSSKNSGLDTPLPTRLAEECSSGTDRAFPREGFEAYPSLPLRLRLADLFESPLGPPHWEFVTVQMELHFDLTGGPEKKADYGLYVSPIR